MYHPARPQGTETNYDESGFEFIEIVNTGTLTVGLAGLAFSDGIIFEFTGSDVSCLAPGERVIAVNNLAAFTNRYPVAATINIAGEYHGRFFLPGALDNSGEKLIKDFGLGFL